MRRPKVSPAVQNLLERSHRLEIQTREHHGELAPGWWIVPFLLLSVLVWVAVIWGLARLFV